MYSLTWLMNSTEVQNPRCKLDVFGSVLACVKSDHVFQKLSYPLCRLCLSLSSLITLPQTVRLFYVSLRSQAPQQSQTDLFTWTYTVGIPFWTTHKRQSQTSKFDGKTTIACSKLRDHTFTIMYVLWSGIWNIAREENGWHSHGKFIMLLTFELSSFRENGFSFLRHFPHCSHWYLSLDA